MSINIPKGSSSVLRTALAGLFLAQASGCMIHFGKMETHTSEESSRDFDNFGNSDFFGDKAGEIRQRLIECVLDGPEDDSRFKKNSEERVDGVYEEGKFIYEDKNGKRVRVSVESEKRASKKRFSSYSKSVDKARVDGATKEEALEACEEAY